MPRLHDSWSAFSRATHALSKAASLRNEKLVIAQLHGPLFQQFDQVAAAARLSAQTGREFACDRSARSHYPSSPNISRFLSAKCRMVDLFGITLKRAHEPSFVQRADKRRGLKSFFSPLLLGYHELEPFPVSGSVVLHGYPGFARMGDGEADLSALFRQPDHRRSLEGQLFFTSGFPHSSVARVTIDGSTEEVHYTDKAFAHVFERLLGCQRIVTNNERCAFWSKVICGSEADVELRA